jgi:aldose 1-epimerase
MDLQQLPYGKTGDDQQVDQFIIANNKGITAQITNYGGILVGLQMPDRNGRIDNICLGFDDLEGYLQDHPFFGTIVGRFANRISGGRFYLDGKSYTLACNERGVNHLHGGISGFDKKVWRPEPFINADQAGVKLYYTSPDEEEGYPGCVHATVTYSLNEKSELAIDYKATTDWTTPVNLTNHAYWNLAGAGRGTVLDQELELACPSYLAADENLIPTGPVQSVFNTALDFTTRKPIGRDIDQVGGYDHCFVIARPHEGLVQAARAWDAGSGRSMEVWTTKPGVQLYTGNHLGGIVGAGGAVYNRYCGFCLETQFYPDSVNQLTFPSPILRPGKTYHHMTIFKLIVE